MKSDPSTAIKEMRGRYPAKTISKEFEITNLKTEETSFKKPLTKWSTVKKIVTEKENRDERNWMTKDEEYKELYNAHKNQKIIAKEQAKGTEREKMNENDETSYKIKISRVLTIYVDDMRIINQMSLIRDYDMTKKINKNFITEDVEWVEI